MKADSDNTMFGRIHARLDAEHGCSPVLLAPTLPDDVEPQDWEPSTFGEQLYAILLPYALPAAAVLIFVILLLRWSSS